MSYRILDDPFNPDGSLFPRVREEPDFYTNSPSFFGNSSSGHIDDYGSDNLNFMLPQAHEDPELSNESKITDNRQSKTKEKLETKRCTKKIFTMITETDIKKQIRAERNRILAKESRDRKKNYIAYLESKVNELQNLVDIYKRKLSKYELIDKYANFTEINSFPSVHQILKECTAMETHTLDSRKYCAELLSQRHEKIINERNTAVESLIKKLIDAILPLPARFGLWLREFNVDFDNMNNLKEVFGPNAPLDQFKILKDMTEKMWDNKEKMKEFRTKVMIYWDNIKNMIKKFLEDEAKLKLEFARISEFMKNTLLSKFEPQFLSPFTKLIPFIASKPEIVNYADSIIAKTRLEVENTMARSDADTYC